MSNRQTTIIRLSLAAILILGVLDIAGCGKRQTKRLDIDPPQYRMRLEKNVMVPMSDGVKLASDIYYPVGLEKVPVILARTPYGKGMMKLGDSFAYHTEVKRNIEPDNQG